MFRITLTLLSAGFLLSAQIPDFTPPTPLLGAVLTNNVDAAKALLDNGTNPNEGRFFGTPALTFAVIQANQAMVTTLLAHGADLNAGDRHGSTPLMWAAGGERPDPWTVDELLRRGANPNTVNSLGETALTWAIRRGDMAMVDRLLAGGASDTPMIRRSVENAVALLQKSGPQFVKVSGCVSCHHQSIPQMANAAARRRNFHVDETIATQQTKAVLAMFKPVREAMEKGTTQLPNPGISVSYSLLGLAAEGYPADDLTRAMTLTIERTQLPDGSFAILPARPPMEASTVTATALSIRALRLYGRDSDARIIKARQWLLNAQPASMEERNMRLLGLVWSGAPESAITEAAQAVLSQQRPDGGWAQLPGRETDAYATGQALVALQEAGMPAVSQQIRHGMAFLLRTQLDDGSWLVRTRSSPLQPLKESGFPHGRDQWISATATSWAAMALALSQPESAPQLTTAAQ
jgi:hypothetical protein